MSIKCPKCGYENKDDALICGLCSELLKQQKKEEYSKPHIPKFACQNHPMMPAQGFCSICKKEFCNECLSQYEGQIICTNCKGIKVSSKQAQKSKLIKIICGFILIGGILFLVYNFILKKDSVTITGDSIVIASKNTDYHFSRLELFSGTYIICGGAYTPPEADLMYVSISGLKIEDARSIYKDYPDFYMCKSPGAPLAQSRVIDLTLIPFDSRIASTLKDTVDAYKVNLQGSDHKFFCIKLEGAKVKMESAKVKKEFAKEMEASQVREMEEWIMSHHSNREYYLIASAEQVNGKETLEGK